jgi:hypothetical protein
MKPDEKNYIQYGNVVAIFIPGLLQIENNQKYKGILFIFAFIAFFSLGVTTMNISYQIFSLYVYAFEVLDSFSIVVADKEKRRSISEAALKHVDKGTIQLPNQSGSFVQGEKFEKFVRERFNKEKFTIVKQTIPVPNDIAGPFVENNLDPDFIIRYKPNLEKFAVEAKFRSTPRSPYDVIYPEQMARYKQFEKEEKIPVYIVIGYGGIPENPEKIFLVPLRRVNSDRLPIESLGDNSLSKYEMDRNNLFDWRPGSVWNSGGLRLPDGTC